ncbi:hypothetical protein J1N35_025917 [Gossypium stocksii]|uniref:Putative plant transposon protein domain-containing protein n=1 Tax=Gossypium stocksii TaxID=47602 RepID=A0A9D3V740_9ROSI|nr:hypothetical protein J1N35_025917 [Gossypium stocksii]
MNIDLIWQFNYIDDHHCRATYDDILYRYSGLLHLHSCRKEYLKLISKVWFYFIRCSFMPISQSSTISIKRMLLLYAILTEKSINVGKIILKEIHDRAKKKTGSACFPSFITSLYLRAHVKTQANLKGQYVQGCITNHDLERLVEKVHELNQGNQEEPIELDTKELTNEIDTKANSMINILICMISYIYFGLFLN